MTDLNKLVEDRRKSAEAILAFVDEYRLSNDTLVTIVRDIEYLYWAHHFHMGEATDKVLKGWREYLS